MDKKRILLIILFILVTLGIAFALYYVFFKAPTVPTEVVITPTNVAPGALPGAPSGLPPAAIVIPTAPSPVTPLPTVSSVAQGGLTKVTTLYSNTTISPTLAADGSNLNFYNPIEGKFYRITTDGKTQPLSDKTFFDVQKITWAPNSDKAILEYPDSSKTLYDFNQGKQVTLPKHWTGFSFSSQGDKILAKSVATDPNNRWLIVANPDGTNAEPIIALGENQDKVIVKWSPDGGVAALSDTGFAQGIGRKQIIPIGLNGENYNPLLIEGFDFQPKWSTNGDTLLYSTYSADTNYNPTLWLTNAKGGDMGTGRHKLNIDTWADKCVFSNATTLYCAVPQDLQEGMGLVPSLSSNSVDQLYKIDLTTNIKTLIAKTETTYSMRDLVVSKDGSTLYFVDNNSDQLQKINLK